MLVPFTPFAPHLRSIDQLNIVNCRLVIPYDEFLVMHHALVEWEMRNPNVVDMYTYFEQLLRETLKDLAVSGRQGGIDW